jgi:hypothetical protein
VLFRDSATFPDRHLPGSGSDCRGGNNPKKG